jgi:hypothetical protein
MQIVIGAVLLACWFIFLRACYHMGQDRRARRTWNRLHDVQERSRELMGLRERRQLDAWLADRELYRRERGR